MVPRLTRADKVLVAAGVCLIAASYVVANTASGRGSEVVIEVDGKAVHKTSLREEHVINVHGTHGQLTVEIRAGKVAITHADCPNHVCVRTGWRSRSGEVIVCVPNKTVVRILSGKTQGVRATTG